MCLTLLCVCSWFEVVVLVGFQGSNAICFGKLANCRDTSKKKNFAAEMESRNVSLLEIIRVWVHLE